MKDDEFLEDLVNELELEHSNKEWADTMARLRAIAKRIQKLEYDARHFGTIVRQARTLYRRHKHELDKIPEMREDSE